MIPEVERVTASLSKADVRRLDVIAEERGLTRAAVIRKAVAHYCDAKESEKVNLRRMAMVVEYTSVLLDMSMREQSPERIRSAVEQVAYRMEKFHDK